MEMSNMSRSACREREFVLTDEIRAQLWQRVDRLAERDADLRFNLTALGLISAKRRSSPIR